MQASKLLQKFFNDACDIHKKRLNILFIAGEALVKTKNLSLVGLGRGLINHYLPKSNINRMDRLVGNRNLFKEKGLIYKTMCSLIIGKKTKPRILVDWSSASVAERYQVLRAAVALKGRSLTVYEEVHPLESYGNPEVHKNFLAGLKRVLPADCKPIIVTDAGFGVPWFRAVLQFNWDFVGRIINKSYYQAKNEEWYSISDLLRYRKVKIKCLGEVKLTKINKFVCYLQTHKSKNKGRIRKNAYGDKASRCVSKRCAKSARNAWVLVHSLGKGIITAERVAKIYASRMQIEESFRDVKSHKYGFGLRDSRSLGVLRITNLFLIALIGMMIAWLVGLCAKRRNMHYSFQTNSIKNRNVLSIFYLGLQVISHATKFKRREFLDALAQIREFANEY